ncbi:hypothetical protein HUJ04_005466 [Dendroctonus ponderosae]|nr:hypothetical protein HUJ04_005466 [Dendroctonus ponderosae]
MAKDDKLFFHKTVMHLARSLANLKNTPWEKLERLNAYRTERRFFKQLIKEERREWVERDIESVCDFNP